MNENRKREKKDKKREEEIVKKQKDDIWKYCQICRFSIGNGLEWTHLKEGNFHIKCLGEIEKVNHPKHYNIGKIEVIDFIEDQKLEFHEGNAVKYIARAKHKGKEEEDLEKAVWYLNRKLKKMKSEVSLIK